MKDELHRKGQLCASASKSDRNPLQSIDEIDLDIEHPILSHREPPALERVVEEATERPRASSEV
jgi:hypothetical protein